MKHPMLLNKKGQSVLSEYVVIFFLVVTAAVAMAVYVQRALQARVFDARNYAINQVSQECDENCLAATGGVIAREYEPYYGNIESNTDRRQQDASAIEGGLDKNEGLFHKSIDVMSNTVTTSRQKPPKDAN